MSTRIAHEIVLDKPAGEIRIDGLVYPFYVHPAVDVVGLNEDELAGVTMTTYADNVTVIDVDGTTTRPVVATHETELAWAREEGRRIVRRGLADVDPEQIRARESAPIYEAVVSDHAASRLNAWIALDEIAEDMARIEGADEHDEWSLS